MSLYTPAGFFLVRSPALPVDPYVEALDGRGRGARDHLWTLGEQPLVRQAVRVASHSLAEELEKSAPGADSRAADRMHSSLLRYLSRMSSRPTPYGLFAQVEAGSSAKPPRWRGPVNTRRPAGPARTWGGSWHWSRRWRAIRSCGAS